MITHRHWRVPPHLDARTSLPPAQRGELAPGHTRSLPCAPCASPPAPEPSPSLEGEARAVAPTRRAHRRRRIDPQPSPVPPAPEEAPVPAAPSAPAPWVVPAAAPSHTLRQAILLALASLGDGPAAPSDLVVRAWERSPDQFGLRGYERQYPDANKVLAKLSGADGLIGLGWCTRTEGSAITITPAGRRQVAALAKGGAR